MTLHSIPHDGFEHVDGSDCPCLPYSMTTPSGLFWIHNPQDLLSQAEAIRKYASVQLWRAAEEAGIKVLTVVPFTAPEDKKLVWPIHSPRT